MMRRAPPKAPTGMPPPMTLPKVARSGAMPVSSAAPPRARRNPEITSSKISSAPCALRERTQLLQELGALQQQAVVGRHRFDDDGGDARALACEQRLRRRLIIERQHARGGGEGLGHAGRGRAPEGGEPGAGRDQQVIGVAVIAAGELDDQVAPGERRAPRGWRSSPPRCRRRRSAPAPRPDRRAPRARPAPPQPAHGAPKVVPRSSAARTAASTCGWA